MNEIDKLKIEHARYKKALVRIQKEYGDESDACIYASAALNAPPPATLESLQTVAKYHNMNKIYELRAEVRAEHARYKKALEDIKRGVYNTEPSAIANEALNPSPPVTLEQLLAALKNKNCAGGGVILYSVRFFSDQSGYLYGDNDRYFKSFLSLREALRILTPDQ